MHIFTGNYDSYISQNTTNTTNSVKQYAEQLNKLKELLAFFTSPDKARLYPPNYSEPYLYKKKLCEKYLAHQKVQKENEEFKEYAEENLLQAQIEIEACINIIQKIDLLLEQKENQSFEKFYADIDQVMAIVFEVESAKPLLSTVGFICKSVTLWGYVGVVVPVTVISMVLGVCAMPSGGFNRGMKIAAMPLLIPSTIIRKMVFEDLPEIYRGYTELMKSKGTATNR